MAHPPTFCSWPRRTPPAATVDSAAPAFFNGGGKFLPAAAESHQQNSPHIPETSMRTVNVLALVLILAAIFAAVLTIPSYILSPLIEMSPDLKLQRESMRQSALKTVKKFEQRHGETPIEQWPELDRQIWTNARRILDETDSNP
jgi:hypothetical protein